MLQCTTAVSLDHNSSINCENSILSTKRWAKTRLDALFQDAMTITKQTTIYQTHCKSSNKLNSSTVYCPDTAE